MRLTKVTHRFFLAQPVISSYILKFSVVFGETQMRVFLNAVLVITTADILFKIKFRSFSLARYQTYVLRVELVRSLNTVNLFGGIYYVRTITDYV